MRCVGPSANPIYQGPGDVVAGASSFWGLRAYTLASIGTKAIRLRRDSDNTEQDFNTTTGGGLDPVAIATFKGSANLFVTKLYDQVGTNHLIQATAANQPSYQIKQALGTTPVIVFGGTTPSLECATLSFSGSTAAQTWTTVGWADPTNGYCICTYNVSNDPGLFWATANGWEIFGSGTLLSVGLTGSPTSLWTSVTSVWNTTSSDICVNGTSNTGTTDAMTVRTNASISNQGNPGPYCINSAFIEWGVWLSVFSPANKKAMNNNQQVYWGL